MTAEAMTQPPYTPTLEVYKIAPNSRQFYAERRAEVKRFRTERRAALALEVLYKLGLTREEVLTLLQVRRLARADAERK